VLKNIILAVTEVQLKYEGFMALLAKKVPDQSRRHGGLWWAYPPQTKLQAPKLKRETL